ncbi:hypothetical protein [Aurantiacibacter gangjinensis]|uniref:Uncharacterized protein n=1 Tax=Aurantiacibacter gangjinensis TaxID=502682 RepID=A0A0G9MTR8_9SPHN|nr:hypothetical protein [Aurantiacibacter gangjinensis]APE28488.1 hypothetical protein BMF35_a1659 [Aurantiacibacter gangjinensis]KLE32693.1 hypothetical protein AAW01_01160 [Aurantiacibacter gangjinensis]
MKRLILCALPLMLVACMEEPQDAPAEEVAPENGSLEPMEDAVLDLQGTGIVIPAQGGFEELAVPFGSLRAPTEATLANYVGSATDESDTPNDCGLTFTQYQGLTLNFRDGEFVGYWAEAPYVPEFPRLEFLEADNIQLVAESTLDHEFVIGDPSTPTISGVFESESDDAAIRALWAGEACVAR